MMKKISVFIIFFLMFFLVSCNIEDTTNKALEEFGKYQATADTAIVVDNTIIYFSSTKLDLNELVKEHSFFNNEKEEEHILNGGLIVKKDKVYFSTTVNKSGYNNSYSFEYNFCYYVFEFDLNSETITRVFSRENMKTSPSSVANNMVFYYEHYTNNATDDTSRIIDAYDIINMEHKRVASGKESSLSLYREKNTSDYIGKLLDKPYIPLFKDESYYEIKNKKTNESKIINQDFIEKTKYAESLLKFDYSTKRIDISNGKILITLTIKAGNGINHPYLVFEYDYEKESLEFKQINFLDVDVLVDIIYLE